MAISIVNATIEHIDQVFLIENSEIFIPWQKQSIQDLLKQENVVFRVLLMEDEVIGYYSFAQIIDEGHINNIAIKREHQSKGFGSLLLTDMINITKEKNICALTLEVEEGNTKAINLYNKFNFKVEGIRKKYYKNTKDAIIMWRR